MAKSIEDQVLDRKTKEQIRQELLEVVNTKVKDELVETIANDVRESFDDEYKTEIKKEIEQELMIDIKEDLRKEQAKISRRKSFKIFRLYIYMLVLIAIICYLVYLLYNNGGLDILDKYKIVKQDATTTTTTKALVVKDFNYYYSNYGHLIDKINITNYDLLKGNYNIMSVEVEDRLGMAYKNLSDDNINVEGMIYTFTDEVLKNSYKELFGSDDGYESRNFIVDNISYAFQDSTSSYIAIPTSVATEEIKNIITDIKEENNKLIFTCKVALVKNFNEVYNINDLETSIGTITNESELTNFNEALSNVKYTFTIINGIYYITDINV